ncbi:hypothetical protein NQ024_10340 [Corynebacterium sp. 35RC1]|nr:hypothetical protein [Corynebacterium sp. 35RC1]
MQFNFNEKALQQHVQPALRSMANTLNKEFASLSRTHQEKPVEEIKREVQRIFNKHGGSIGDQEAASYAELISEGKQVKFKA